LVFLRSVRRLIVAACVVPSSPIFVTLMEAPASSETSILTGATRRNNPEYTILQLEMNITEIIRAYIICRVIQNTLNEWFMRSNTPEVIWHLSSLCLLVSVPLFLCITETLIRRRRKRLHCSDCHIEYHKTRQLMALVLADICNSTNGVFWDVTPCGFC
jgi:hypothetical protein